jgi:nitrite reductase/ring-hydroxylating ferredoxin subunit
MAATERLIMTAPTEKAICARIALKEGGLAQRFAVLRRGHPVQCFAVAYDGDVHAYVNSCPHRGTELDWQPGEVFDQDGLYLVCATHGAVFEADSGHCSAGPCRGAALARVPVEIRDGVVMLVDDVLASCEGESSPA